MQHFQEGGPGSWLLGSSDMVKGGVVALPQLPQRHSLARFVQQSSCRTLAAQQQVLLQCLLVEHPVCHAEGSVTWGGGISSMKKNPKGREKMVLVGPTPTSVRIHRHALALRQDRLPLHLPDWLGLCQEVLPARSCQYMHTPNLGLLVLHTLDERHHINRRWGALWAGAQG